MNRLSDQVAVITQAQSHLSLECARQFSDEGARLVLCSENPKALEQLVTEIEENGGEAVSFCSALENEEQAKALVEEALKNFGQIDVVVNNTDPDLPEGSDEDGSIRSQKLKTLLESANQLSHAAATEMADADHPAIISLAPLFASKDPAYPAYVKTLAGLIGLCRSRELREICPQVRINAVFPGSGVLPIPAMISPETLAGEMMSAMDEYEEFSAPAPDPEDLANIALFLASDEAKAINGQAIVADYGASIN